jgi:anaerobic C4-dicarboxylate transporter
MRASTILSVLATAAALTGAVCMFVVPWYSESSCEAAPGTGRTCTESSETLSEHEGIPLILTLAAVPIALTSGATVLAFLAPRARAMRWAVAIVCLLLCFVTTIGVFFLPASLLLLTSVGLDRARPAHALQAVG